MKKLSLLLLFCLFSFLLSAEIEISVYPNVGKVCEKSKGHFDSWKIPMAIIPSSLVVIVDGKTKNAFFLEAIYPETKKGKPYDTPEQKKPNYKEKSLLSFPYNSFSSLGKWKIRWRKKSRSNVEVRYLTHLLSYEAVSHLDLASGEFSYGIYIVNNLMPFKKSRVTIIMGEMAKRGTYYPRSTLYSPPNLSSFLYEGKKELGRINLGKGRTFLNLFTGKVTLERNFLWKAWESPQVEWIISFDNPLNLPLTSQKIWLTEDNFYRGVTETKLIPRGEKVKISLPNAPVKVDKELSVEYKERRYLHRVSLKIVNQSKKTIQGEVIEKKQAGSRDWDPSIPPDWQKGDKVGWEITLPPKKEKEIGYRFISSYPISRTYEKYY